MEAMKSLLPQAIVLLVYTTCNVCHPAQKLRLLEILFFLVPSATHLILFLFFTMRFFALIFYNEESSKINKRKKSQVYFYFSNHFHKEKQDLPEYFLFVSELVSQNDSVV